MINIDLFLRKSFRCLTRVVHTTKTATISSEMKYIFYSPNTTHDWFRFKKRFEVR